MDAGRQVYAVSVETDGGITAAYEIEAESPREAAEMALRQLATPGQGLILKVVAPNAIESVFAMRDMAPPHPADD